MSRFQPGNRSGGRPVGARNKLQRDFLEALATDFAEHGPGVIRIARIEKPVEYLKIIASVLPRELLLEQNVLTEMSDEDIAASLSLLQKLQLNKRTAEEQESPPDSDTTRH